uniref:Uncharacterized protein n=1 Tax=Romanomermis culicivorax TaxID=13658 RepID=A0A915I9Z9_ROMCU
MRKAKEAKKKDQAQVQPDGNQRQVVGKEGNQDEGHYKFENIFFKLLLLLKEILKKYGKRHVELPTCSDVQAVALRVTPPKTTTSNEQSEYTNWTNSLKGYLAIGLPIQKKL